MRRKSLYTAIGRFERRTNSHGQACPVILLGGNEYILDLQEMALWTSLSWRIARKEEIPTCMKRPSPNPDLTQSGHWRPASIAS